MEEDPPQPLHRLGVSDLLPSVLGSGWHEPIVVVRMLEARLIRFSTFATMICIASDLILGEQDKKTKVLYVQPQSDSTQAGITAGYELVAIDGEPVNSKTLSQIETQIGLRQDRAIVLKFKLGGKTKTLNIK